MNVLARFLLAQLIATAVASAFVVQHQPTFRSPTTRRQAQAEVDEQADQVVQPEVVGVVAPLHNKGPYPCLSLYFPNVDAANAYDFLLDTGSNINSIDANLVAAQELPTAGTGAELGLVGRIGGSVFYPGPIIFLGDCQLVGLPGDPNTFMTDLQAAALPAPGGGACAGRLGVPFLSSFTAGVMFEWHGTKGDPPAILFYYGDEIPEQERNGLMGVPLQRLPTEILAITINLGGDTLVSAVLDTGSDITIVSPQVAEHIGIQTEPNPVQAHDDVGDVGTGGEEQPSLRRSTQPISVQAIGCQAGPVSLGQAHVHVGELPGMTNLLLGMVGTEGGLEDASQVPGVILGLDFLRQSYRMAVRVQANEVWFEPLTTEQQLG